MIRYLKLRTAEYYIEASERLGAESRLGVNQKKGDKYYTAENGKKKVDPLYRPLVIYGAGAKHLSLAEGQQLTSEQFRNLYYGYSPDGREPLHAGVAPIREQIDASKKVRAAELAKKKAQADLKHAEFLLEQTPGKIAEQRVQASRKNVESASAELDKLMGDDAYRRNGEDIAFSPPADVSIMHARLLADGKFAEAKELEDFFLSLVKGEMERVSKFATTSAGRNDAKGIRGEEVELAYSIAVHFDARPDEENITGHCMHAHVICPNYGRTKDGEWKPVRIEWMKRELAVSDAYINSSLSVFLQQRYGADMTFKESRDGRLLPEFGASRHLKTHDSKMHGRSKQIEANEKAGMSAEIAKLANKKQKDDMTGFEHIQMQKELLRDAGLTTIRSIAGSKREREKEIQAKAERRLIAKYQNEFPRWFAYEQRQGFPNGRPEPFRGEEARRYMQFTELVKEARKTGVPHKPPPNPLAPPGFAGYKKEFWDKSVELEISKIRTKEFERFSLSPDDLVEHMSTTENFFTERDVREEIARRVAAHPPKNILGLPKKLKPDEMLEYVRSRTDEAYRAFEKSGYAVKVVAKNGKTAGFVSVEQRRKELELYGQSLPKLFEKSDGVRNMTSEQVDAFLADWQKQKGFAFKPKQAQVARDVLTSQTRGLVVQGFAGSGKTAIAECIVSMLKHQGYKTIACAPSNSAMQGLKDEIKAQDGYTPQRLMDSIGKLQVVLDENTIVFMDETSMLDVASGAPLLHEIQKTGARVILSGDKKQLASVGAGNLMEHALDIAAEAERVDPDGGKRVTKINEDYTDSVHTIQRQTSRTGRQLVAELQTSDFQNAWRTMRANDMLRTPETETDCIEQICGGFRSEMEKHVGDAPARMKAYLDAKRNGGDVESARLALVESLSRHATEGYRRNLILAETNNNVARLSAGVRRDLQELGLLSTDEITIRGEKGPLKVAVGERLVLRDKTTTKDGISENRQQFEYTKGTPCLVADIRHEKDGPVLTLLLDKKNDRGVDTIEIRANDFSALAYGTAMTVHLSQGASVSNVWGLPGPNSNSELALVMASRFKDKFLMFVPKDREAKTLKSMSKKIRAPDALDFDRMSQEGDVEDIARFAGAKEHEREKVESDARAEAVGIFKEKIEKSDPELAQTAEAVRRVADELKRPEIARAAKRGIVRREAGLLGRWGGDASENKSWLGETEEGDVLAYDSKTGRIEAWRGKGAKQDGADSVAKGSTFGRMLRETIRDAVENDRKLEPEGLIRGRIVEMGVAPLHDSPSEKPTPFVKLIDTTGEPKTIWGADLGRALRDFKVGDGVELDGSQKASVEVFSSKKLDGGDPEPRKGQLVEAPKDGKPAVIRIGKIEAKVYGRQAEGWSDKKPESEIEFYSKTVDKRIWSAEAFDIGSKIALEDRKRAWEATEQALNDQAKLDLLAKVGVGKNPFESPKNPKKSAVRRWTAGGRESGEEAIRDWNENVGLGRKTWHEAGLLTKGDDGIAKADLSGIVLHCDKDRVYVALAVHDHKGQIETTSSRITAFKKSELGVKRDLPFGTELDIRVADDLEKPQLLTRLEASEAELRNSRESLLKGMSIEELRELAERPDVEISDEQRRRNAEAGNPHATLNDVGSLNERTRTMKPDAQPAMTAQIEKTPTPAPEPTEAKGAIPEAVEKPRVEQAVQPLEQPREARRQAETTTAKAEQVEAKKAREEAPARAERIEPASPRKTAEQRQEEARVAVSTSILESLDRNDPKFADRALDELAEGADPFRSSEAFSNTIFAYSRAKMTRDDYTILMQRCPPENHSQIAVLILYGADASYGDFDKVAVMRTMNDSGLLDAKPNLLHDALRSGFDPMDALKAGVKADRIMRECDALPERTELELFAAGGEPDAPSAVDGKSYNERVAESHGGSRSDSRGEGRAEAPARVARVRSR